MKVLATAVTASWLVSYLCDLLHLDVLLIPLIILATASILRTGTSIPDRLVAATVVSVGAVLVLGMVTTLTPVRMHPAPTTGILLTVAAIVAWISRRRPKLPLRVRGSDLLVIGSGFYAWYYIHKPVAGVPIAVRLQFATTSEDRFTHYGMFDYIHQTGGYGFLRDFNPKYPQGLHYLLAWIDTYIRSSSDGGPALAAFDRYFGYIQVLCAVMIAATVWAARWVAEPYLRGWRATAACTAVAVVMLTSYFPRMVDFGFDAEMLGITLVALACALMIRPASSAWEHLAIGGALTIAVTYAYNPYSVLVGGMFVCSTVIYRRRYRREMRWLVLGYVAMGLMAALPTLMALSVGVSYQAQAQAPGGGGVLIDKSYLAAFAFAALASLASPAARRVPRPAAAAVIVAGTGVVVLAFASWQKLETGSTSYYFSKYLAAAFVVVLVASPVAGFLLVSAVGGKQLRERFGPVWLAVGMCAIVLSVFGGVRWAIPGNENTGLAWGGSYLQAWAVGEARTNASAPAGVLFGEHPDGFGSAPVLMLSSNDGYQNYRYTRFFAVLKRESVQTEPAADALYYAKLGGPVTDQNDFRAGMAILESAIRACAVPPTVLVGDQDTAAAIKGELAGFPDLSANVMWVPVPA